MTEYDWPGEVEEYECCDDEETCPGTCDYCGFSLCPEALDIVRCDC